MQRGDLLGPYVLDEQLGTGGMGEVWVASDRSGTRVALKAMHPHLVGDTCLRARFEREYEVGRLVDHVGLVCMIEFGAEPTAPYLVMELAEGKSLWRLIERGGAFLEWEAATIIRQVADALACLHAHGIIHHGLKSSNVVVSRERHAKIIDFGIARYAAADRASVGGFAGSPEYSSPEPHFGRQPAEPSDVCSLGSALFEAVTGDVPSRSGHYVDVLRMHDERPVPDPRQVDPEISVETDALIRAMLAKNPSERPSAAAIADRCATILLGDGRPPCLPALNEDSASARVVASIDDTASERRAALPAMLGAGLLGVAIFAWAIVSAVVGGR